MEINGKKKVNETKITFIIGKQGSAYAKGSD